MIEQTSQGGNSHPDHDLHYEVQTKQQKPFQVKCSVCTGYIRLSLTTFYDLQNQRQTLAYFEAMAGECRGPQ